MRKLTSSHIALFFLLLSLSSEFAQSTNNTTATNSLAPTGPLNTRQVVDYLLGISGTKVVAGEHNSPDELPRARTEDIFNLTGKYPEWWSCDFH